MSGIERYFKPGHLNAVPPGRFRVFTSLSCQVSCFGENNIFVLDTTLCQTTLDFTPRRRCSRANGWRPPQQCRVGRRRIGYWSARMAMHSNLTVALTLPTSCHATSATRTSIPVTSDLAVLGAITTCATSAPRMEASRRRAAPEARQLPLAPAYRRDPLQLPLRQLRFCAHRPCHRLMLPSHYRPLLLLPCRRRRRRRTWPPWPRCSPTRRLRWSGCASICA